MYKPAALFLALPFLAFSQLAEQFNPPRANCCLTGPEPILSFSSAGIRT